MGSGINILGGSVATLAGATTVDNGWSGVRVSVFEGAEDNLTVKGVKGDYSFSEVFPIWKEHVTSTVDFEMDSYSVDVVIGPTTDQHYIVFYLST